MASDQTGKLIKFLFIEGIDSSGKTTLRNNLIVKYKGFLYPLMFDRSIYTYYVFNKMDGTHFDEAIQNTYEAMKDKFDITVLYLSIPPELAFERAKQKQDHFKYTIEQLTQMDLLFHEALVKMPLPKTWILNAKFSPAEIAEEAWDSIRLMEAMVLEKDIYSG
jgi:thymidylate kinase